MYYIDTEPLTVHIFKYQREELTNLQKSILIDYEIRIPLSELVRQALKVGLPSICGEKQSILKEMENRRCLN